MSTPTSAQVAEPYDYDAEWWNDKYGRIPWAVHFIGTDDVRTHANPDLGADDPDNPELTQRTALKFAADTNAFADDHPDVAVRAVVLHYGEPWGPNLEYDGPAAAYCEWFDNEEHVYFCNQCFRIQYGHVGCPEHAPVDIPGLQLTDCGDPENHPRTFVYADNAGYGAPCMYCAYASLSEAHEDCEHARHLFWFRWHRLVRALSRLGIVRHYHYTSGCRCAPVTAWAWSKRSAP